MKPPASSPDSDTTILHVLQSCTPAAAQGWQQRCLDSVRAWATQQGHAHHWIDDALFDHLPDALRRRTAGQAVIASDLARLAWMQAALEDGAGAVLWLDADTLIVDPAQFRLPAADFAVGREVWVQADGRRWRSYRKVHHACLLARPGNVALPFYRDAAARIILAHRDGHMVPQLLGPKLLTALHNLAPFPVVETAGVLSPAVIHDLLAGGGPAYARWQRDSAVLPAAVNLCASSVRSDAVSADAMIRLSEQLTTTGWPVFRANAAHPNRVSRP